MSEPMPPAGTAFTEQAGEEYRATRERAGLFDHSPRARIELTGKDAARFLHNLCSQDVLGLKPGSGCEAFFLNIKARVLVHAWIYRIPNADGGESFWLDAGPGQAEKLSKHLDHYRISEDIEIADHTNGLAQLHIAGPSALEVVRKALGQELAELAPLQAVRLERGPDNVIVVRRQDMLGVPGFDLLCRREEAASLGSALRDAGARPAGPAAYETLRIEAGMPAYGTDVDEACLAPEVDRTSQAISYAKGCYLGQEPVVRIRDLGQVQRRLLGLVVSGKPADLAGAKVEHAGQEVGQVTSSAFSPRLGSVVALAYLRRGSQAAGTAVEVETATGRRSALVVGLPFPDSSPAA